MRIKGWNGKPQNHRGRDPARSSSGFPSTLGPDAIQGPEHQDGCRDGSITESARDTPRQGNCCDMNVSLKFKGWVLGAWYKAVDVGPFSQVGPHCMIWFLLKGCVAHPSHPCFAFCHEMTQQQGLCKILALQSWMSQLPGPKAKMVLLIINDLQAGDVVQLILCLPTLHEALGSILRNP